MSWRENWTCGVYNKDVIEYTESNGKFVCRTMQKAEFLSLTKSWSIEDTKFDPEDDIPLLRVPTFDLADLMSSCADEIDTEKYVDIDKEIVFVENLTIQMQRIIPYYLYCIILLREVCSSAKNKWKIEDCTLDTVDINTIYSCSKHNVCVWYMLGNLYYSIIFFDAVALYIKGRSTNA